MFVILGGDGIIVWTDRESRPGVPKRTMKCEHMYIQDVVIDLETQQLKGLWRCIKCNDKQDYEEFEKKIREQESSNG